MKSYMKIAAVLVIGIFAVTGMAIAENAKGPVGKVVSATVDATKNVGNVAGDTVGAVSDTAATATKDVTGAAGDAVQAVSDTAEEATESVLK